MVLMYLIYYFIGKRQNSGKLDKFAKTFRATLHDQFIQTGNKTADKETGFTTEGDASFTSWCTGRRNCLGALIELQLAARQDLMSVGLSLVQVRVCSSSVEGWCLRVHANTPPCTHDTRLTGRVPCVTGWLIHR